jgi:cardiolipin synthase
MNIKHLPNVLTVFRLLLVPVFCVLLAEGNDAWAVTVYLLASATDFLDGYIARRFKVITAFGKFTDPLADKLLQVAALVILTIQARIPLWITIVIVVKELLIGAGGVMLYGRYKIQAAADWYGKTATVLFYAAIAAVILKFPSVTVAQVFVLVALALSLFAFVMYLIRYVRSVRETKKTSAE